MTGEERAATTIALPNDRPAGSAGKIGVLLLNLGTPSGTDYWSMRRYLKEFLSDRRVIEVPRILWWPLLNLVILQARPGRKGKDYASIWNRERDEGPLKTTTRLQAEKLSAWIASGGLGRGGAGIVVDWAMRYADPPVRARIEALQCAGCDRILAVPLYPQYAAATTATACDAVFAALIRMRAQPTLRISPPYYDEPFYIDALARSVRAALAKLDFEPQMLLASFHGMPQAYSDKGDPYYRHCMATAGLLRATLAAPEEKFMVSFQSRFGRDEWLKPYTADTVKLLPSRGVTRLAVITPGFAADCLETLEEIAVENAGYFRAAGGEKFAYIPCLNDSEEGMAVIQAIVARELKGWV